MKRLFLLLLSVVSAAAVSAQETSASTAEHSPELLLATTGDLAAPFTIVGDNGVPGQRRSVASGLWYTKPQGAMYRHYYNDYGQTTTNTYIYIPYNADFTYENQSTNATSTHWYFYNTSSAQYVENADDVDAAGNFVGHLTPGYGLAIPRLTDRFVSEEYTMTYYDAVGFAAGSGWFANDTYADDGYYGWMAFVDNKYVYGTGSFDNHYLFGSGTGTGTWQGYDSEGRLSYVTGSLPMEAVYQNYPAPISPLYVDCVYVDGRVWSETSKPEPLKNDATLTLTLYDLYTGEVLTTLTATTGDYTEWQHYDSSNYGAYSYGCLRFSTHIYDGLFDIEEPFVLDRPVQAIITGWDNDDVNFGLHAPIIQDCDSESALGEASFSVKDTTGKIVVPFTYSYGSGLAIALKFHAVMDNVFVAESLTWSHSDGSESIIDGYNVIRISDDGTTCSNEDIDSSYDFGGLYVQTTMSWIDSAMGVENYTLSDTLDDWGLTMKCETYGSSTNTYRVSFTADAIAEGEGRRAVVYLQGKGISSSTPIYLLQGTAQVEDGITSSSSSAPSSVAGTYTLAGQRVSDSAKGLVIRDGKKVIVK